MKDFVVYTAISAGYNKLADPSALWQTEADFVAFLDAPQTTAGWEIRPLYRRFRDPCRNAKIHKILAHQFFPKAKYSLWLDGSMAITSRLPLHRWIEEYLGGHDLAVFNHRCRTCIYEEAARCLECGLDDPKIIHRQIRQYRRERYPANSGLAECGVVFRRHTKAVSQFNEAWYREIRSHSRRDQLSFNFAAHRLGFKYAHLPGNVLENSHFTRTLHLGMRAQVP